MMELFYYWKNKVTISNVTPLPFGVNKNREKSGLFVIEQLVEQRDVLKSKL